MKMQAVSMRASAPTFTSGAVSVKLGAFADEPIRVCYGTRIAKPMRPWRRSGAATATRDRPIEVHEPNSISRP